MVKKEYKYFGVILLIFLFSILGLITLLKKYTFLTFQHFIKTCQQIVSTFLSSGIHFIGLALIVLALLVAIVFCLKTILSLIKTQKRINELLNFKLDAIPQKLQVVLDKVKFQKERVLVIEKGLSHAFVYGFKSQKIILSEKLIKKLSPKQLEAVVLHEMYHLKNKHSLLLVISEIASSTVFFFPLLRELSNKMRVILEKQADQFTASVQGSEKYLNTALLKVPYSRVDFYPGFTLRRNYKMSKRSVISSTFVISVTIFLFLFPIQVHAIQRVTQLGESECRQTQCGTHCPMSNISR